MHFQKHDLEGTHYSWSPATEHIFNGEPSRRMFDKSNGDQVLFLINLYGSQSAGFTLTEGKQIELRILNDLPATLKSEISVYNWMRETVASSAQ